MPVTGEPVSAAWKRALATTALVLPLLPVSLYLFDGALTAPLWLDEIAYHYWEGDLSLRAQELGRPLSAWIPLLSNYCYGDLQRVVRTLLDVLGLHFLESPEVVLRAASLASYVLALAVLTISIRKKTGSIWSAVLGATVLASTPTFLDQAFEARVYMFSCFVVILYLAILDEAMNRPTPKRLVALALLSLIVAQTHPWTICLFAGLVATVLLGLMGVTALRGRPAVMAAALGPGLFSLGSQWIYLHLTDPGLPGFPLFAPLPWRMVLPSILSAPFKGALYVPRARGALDEIAFQTATALLTAAICWAVASQIRRALDPLLVAALLSLLASSILAGTYGHIVLGRHQVFLYAALFFTLVRYPTKVGAVLLIALATVNASRLGVIVKETHLKSHGKAVSAILARFGSRDDILIVQNPVRWGYPDPTYTFPADFYLNELRPAAPPVKILELPELENVVGRKVITPVYLSGGKPLLARFTATPLDRWREFLDRLEADRLWLLSPYPAAPVEAHITAAFEGTLEEKGFGRSPIRYRLPEYQPALLRLFVRGEGARSHQEAPVPRPN